MTVELIQAPSLEVHRFGPVPQMMQISESPTLGGAHLEGSFR